MARVPRHVTTLARFESLRCLSLQGVGGLSADEVCAHDQAAARHVKSCKRGCIGLNRPRSEVIMQTR